MIRLTAAAPLLLAIATTVVAKPVPTANSSQQSSAAKTLPDFDIAQVMAVFDKIFPAQPEPAPARLALSRTSVQGLFPDGTYARQLADLNAFLATDSGKAFGSQSMAMWVDPDVMRAVMNSLPRIMAAAPAAMQRVEIETATLPKPKSGTRKKP